MPFENTMRTLKRCPECRRMVYRLCESDMCFHCHHHTSIPLYDDNNYPVEITKQSAVLVLEITRECHLGTGDNFLGGIVTAVADYFGPYWIDYAMPDGEKKEAIVIYN